jgi:hypothetical protein
VWNPSTGELLHTLEGHSDWVNAVQFSADGSKLASASNDTKVIVWDANTGILPEAIHSAVSYIDNILGAISSALAQLLTASGSSRLSLEEIECAREAFRQVVRTIGARGRTSTVKQSLLQFPRQGVHDWVWTKGKVEIAVCLLKQAVAIHAYYLGSCHSNGLVIQIMLASALQENGQITEAIAMLERVVGLCEALLAEDNPDRLASQIMLAGAYQANRQFEKAEELFRHVVELQERALGEDHPDRLASQIMLAGVYQGSGKLKEASHLLEHVRTIHNRILGNDHRDRLAFQNMLSGACCQHEQHIGDVEQLPENVGIIQKPVPSEETSDSPASPSIFEDARIRLEDRSQDHLLSAVADKIGKSESPLPKIGHQKIRQGVDHTSQGLAMHLETRPGHTKLTSSTQSTSQRVLSNINRESRDLMTSSGHSSRRQETEVIATSKAFDTPQLHTSLSTSRSERGFLKRTQMVLRGAETPAVAVQPAATIPWYVAPATAAFGAVVAGTGVANYLEARKNGESRRAVEQEDLKNKPIERRFMQAEAIRKEREEKRSIASHRLELFKARLEIKQLQLQLAKTAGKGIDSSPRDDFPDNDTGLSPLQGPRGQESNSGPLQQSHHSSDEDGLGSTASTIIASQANNNGDRHFNLDSGGDDYTMSGALGLGGDKNSPPVTEEDDLVRSVDEMNSRRKSSFSVYEGGKSSSKDNARLQNPLGNGDVCPFQITQIFLDDPIVSSLEPDHDPKSAYENAVKDVSPALSLESRHRGLRSSVTTQASRISRKRSATTTSLQQPVGAIPMADLSPMTSAASPPDTHNTKAAQTSGVSMHHHLEQVSTTKHSTHHADRERDNACNLWGILR